MPEENKSFYIKSLISDPFRQGDIFLNLPFFKLADAEITEIKEDKGEIIPIKRDLSDVVYKERFQIDNVMATIDLMPGIIITQDCDLLRDDYVSFCAIDKFNNWIYSSQISSKSGKKEEDIIKNCEKDIKSFFLQNNIVDGFDSKMIAHFSIIQQVHRAALYQFAKNRKFRLSKYALDHFRIKLSNYFKRYAYNNWYILNREEYSDYAIFKNQKDPSEIFEPFEWQK